MNLADSLGVQGQIKLSTASLEKTLEFYFQAGAATVISEWSVLGRDSREIRHSTRSSKLFPSVLRAHFKCPRGRDPTYL